MVMMSAEETMQAIDKARAIDYPDYIGYIKSQQCPTIEQLHKIQQHILDVSRYSIQPPTILTNEEYKMGSVADKQEERKTKLTYKNGEWMNVIQTTDTIESRNWEFDVPHRDMVCLKEIVGVLSRENPVAFVTYSVDDIKTRDITVKKREKVGIVDGTMTYRTIDKVKTIKERHKKVEHQVAYVHRSIIAKANIIAPDGIVEDALTTPFPGVYELRLIQDMTIQSVTEWVQNIKAAEWGVFADRENIRVVIPKI